MARRHGHARGHARKALFSLTGLDSTPPLKGPIVRPGERLSDKKPPLSGCLVAGMHMKEIHASVRRIGALVGLGAIAGGLAPAQAQQPAAPSAPPVSGFSNSMSTRPAANAAQKYQDAGSQRMFSFELSTNGGLLKFDDSPEVVPLRANTAQRGDSMFRSDTGELMLRQTEQGGVITYFSGNMGAPAEIVGMAPPFGAPVAPASLESSRKEASTRLSKLAGHDVTVFGTQEFANQAAWAADALMIARIGVEAAAKESAAAVRTLRAVRIMHARGPSVTYSADGELLIGINPDVGYAGRPSSDAIVQQMMARLHGG